MSPAYVGVDGRGMITHLSDVPPAEAVSIEAVDGLVLPGFQNAHSHAFQYGMAGMAEKHCPGSQDDFWSWREAMYACALTLSADEVEHIAAQLYAEMLRKGYTHVAEFHYLHHDKAGRHYANLAEMGERLVSAAATAGIKITLVPVFYQRGGFGQAILPRQIRFFSATVEDYLKLLDASAAVVRQHVHARLGFGVHSLRAVDAPDIFRTFELGPRDLPFHLHAAEQLKEIEDCVAYLGERPISWLLNNLPLNQRFHLVHGTHMIDTEVTGLARSGAHVVLCPGTEGNLGDGIFQFTAYNQQYGQWSIGTDSHISLNPLEDLRWLDYAQRFTTHKRNTFDDGASVLINKSIAGGRKAMGLSIENHFAVGQLLDAVVYRASSPLLYQAAREHQLPAIVYTADASDVLGTLVDGRWIVKDQHHIRQENITSAFRKVTQQRRPSH